MQRQLLIHDPRPVNTKWEEEDERGSVESTRETNPLKVQELAKAFGFKVLEIEGDGNCFFSAAAAQIKKLLENHEVSTSLINYFHILGLHCDASTLSRNVLSRNGQDLSSKITNHSLLA